MMSMDTHLHLSPLLSQVIEDDILNHKPSIDAVNKLLESSDPPTAASLRPKAELLNSRYDKVARATDNHGNMLQGMLDKLGAFESEVDQLEDWVMPTIAELESRELPRMDLNECDKKLKVRPQRYNHLFSVGIK